MFQHLAPYAGDPILSLVETFKRDPRAHKINLSIGIYFDNDGNMTQPESVKTAEQRVGIGAKDYLPMEGHAGLRAELPKLLFGANHRVIAEQRVTTVQTLGGSGALRLGADLLHNAFGNSKVLMSDPTWDNHRGIFAAAGFELGSYPYYDPATIGVKFAEMCECLNRQPENTIILLHPCCHNPTGVDLSPAQWDEVLNIIAARKLIPFMDIAYQGFGDDFNRDAYAIRRAADLELPVLVSSSFSKNMSLYAQRVGLLAVVCPDRAQAELVQGRLKAAVRRIYSSPPAYGALLAQAVLTDDALKEQWQDEVAAMRGRIGAMRQALYDALAGSAAWQQDAARFVRQRGMFGYTGLNAEQVERLRRDYGIYLPASGRLCIAGLNPDNLERTADALKAVKAA